jgi:hypothetical protein
MLEWKHETHLGPCHARVPQSIGPYPTFRVQEKERKKERKKTCVSCTILVRPGKLVTKFWDVEKYGTIDGSRGKLRKIIY